MFRCIASLLLSLTCLVSFAQQKTSVLQMPPPSPMTPGTPMSRPGPPPSDATPAQLEITADELRAHNMVADALDYYGAAIKRGGNAVLLHNKMGIAELNSTQLDRAKKQFELCIKLQSDYADGYNNLGATWYAKSMPRDPRHSINQGDVKKAIKYYERAIELHEETASFHSNLGTAYFARKEYDKANNEYQRALQLDPDVFERRSKVGIQALIMTHEDRAKFNFYLARLYAQQGSFDLALKCLRKALEDGFNRIDEVYTDVNFASLRKDPRFNELMTAKPTAIPQ
jgi:tetratricopeptide (TPR) repeat protein